MASRLRAPWISLGFVIAAVAASLTPGVRDALIFERGAIRAGEWWRLWTGHLVHSWLALAAVDLTLVLLFGAWIEQRSRAAVALAIGLGTSAASLVVLAWRPDLEHYQGSSAVASALFVLLAASIVIDGREKMERFVALSALVLFVLKTGAEVSEAASWTVVPLPDGVEVVGIAHAVGGVAGFATAAVLSCTRRASSPRPMPGSPAPPRSS